MTLFTHVTILTFIFHRVFIIVLIIFIRSWGKLDFLTKKNWQRWVVKALKVATSTSIALSSKKRFQPEFGRSIWKRASKERKRGVSLQTFQEIGWSSVPIKYNYYTSIIKSHIRAILSEKENHEDRNLRLLVWEVTHTRLWINMTQQ